MSKTPASKKNMKKKTSSPKKKVAMKKTKKPSVAATPAPKPMPKVGKAAPAFALKDQDGKMRSLAEFSGKWVLVYFYPKDDTPGCTKEACMLRDGFPLFEKLRVTVLGVSVDSVASHKKFVEKYSLPFTLLSDEAKKVVSAYGVWGEKMFMGRKYLGTNRASFLIAPDRTVAKVYPKVDPATHADEVLKDLETLRKT